MDQEIQAAAYLQGHGFFVRRGVKISMEGTHLDATDIDVFGVRFSSPWYRETVVIDCKDRRKSKPFERILWVCGLRDAAHASRAMVVLPKSVPWQAFSFANGLSVEILREDCIEEFLSKRNGFGECSEAFQLCESRCRATLSYSEKDLIPLKLRLQSMLTHGHPITNINAAIGILEELTQKTTDFSYVHSWYSLYVCYEAATIIAAMLCYFICEVKFLSEKDWVDYALKKLTYGDIPPKKAMALAKSAFHKDFYDGFPAPHYAEEFIHLVSELMKRGSTRFPSFVEAKLISRAQLDEKNELLVKRFLSLLSYASGISAEIWETELLSENVLKLTKTDRNQSPNEHKSFVKSIQKANKIGDTTEQATDA